MLYSTINILTHPVIFVMYIFAGILIMVQYFEKKYLGFIF